MSEAFLGEIRLFGFNFAPMNWMLCQGQLLPITQNTALFSLLGTNFGGNGTTIFQLPNLVNTVATGASQQTSPPGLTPYVPGETGGASGISLLITETPAHTHTAQTAGARFTSDSGTPGPLQVFAKGVQCKPYTPGNPAPKTVAMAPFAVSPFTGGSQPHNNMMPYLTLNYSICINGIFPPRS
jgi:microcystin-dependent protein